MTRRLAAVLGWPIAHSRSPAMHDAGFAAAGVAATMLPFAVPPPALADAVRGLVALDALGASVTVPHKTAIMALCDEVTPAATAIGAVNCLQLRAGRVIGHNTDAGGFVDGLHAAGITLTERRAVLLGGGGAARAVAAGLADADVPSTVVARRPDAVDWTQAAPWAQLPDLLSAASLVVDCTSAGLEPQADAELAASVPLAALPAHAVVATLVYHRSTALLRAAGALGLATVDGRLMLLYQATRAFTLWTGVAAPLAAMRAALDASLAR